MQEITPWSLLLNFLWTWKDTHEGWDSIKELQQPKCLLLLHSRLLRRTMAPEMKHSRQYRTFVLFSWEIGSKKNHTSRGHFLLLLFFMASHFDKQAYEREVPPKFRWLLQKMVELVISGIHVLAWDELISRDLAPCTLQQSICCLHTQILPEEGPGVNIYWASFVPWKYINRSRSLSKTHATDISCRL